MIQLTLKILSKVVMNWVFFIVCIVLPNTKAQEHMIAWTNSYKIKKMLDRNANMS